MKAKKKRIVIIGSGASGLTLAYYLQRHSPFEVMLLEKESRCGGWVRTLRSDEGLFEAGPRGVRLRGKSGAHFLSLCKQLGLTDKMIGASPEAAKRFIYLNQRLESVESKPWRWPFSQATRGLGLALLAEPFQPMLPCEDMSLESFFTERLGKGLYKRLIEPGLLGIFGTAGSKLSTCSCLPMLWQWRSEHRGLVLGALSQWRKASQQADDRIEDSFTSDLMEAPLVSFKEGMEQLIYALRDRLMPSIYLEEELKGLRFSGTSFEVETSRLKIEADRVIISCSPWNLPSKEMKALSPAWLNYAHSVSSSSLNVVHLAYQPSLPKEHGFGYLVAPHPSETILGAVIDSNIFPQHNRDCLGRISVMMSQGCSEEREAHAMKIAELAVAKHLRWQAPPAMSRCSLARGSLPIYSVGHQKKWLALQADLCERSIPLSFIGLGWQGVALSDCMAHAKEVALALASS